MNATQDSINALRKARDKHIERAIREIEDRYNKVINELLTRQSEGVRE